MPTKLLRQIKNTIPELRKSEKLVADFVLNDPKSVITMKTAEASNAIGISAVSYTHLTLPTKA